jgi:DNA-binding response OmpR family regulator
MTALPGQLPSPARRRVLIVENEAPIRESVRLHLTRSGFDVIERHDGAAALELVRVQRFDVLVLDATLPGLDGLTLCRALRRHGANVDTPILMVTARNNESDTVSSLESGADDCLPKPFGMRELCARVGAILRRSTRSGDRRTAPPASEPAQGIQCRDLCLDRERRRATVRGDTVALTKLEFDLLYLLAARPGIVFSRVALLARVWGGDTDVTERTVDTVMSRLRRKIERDPQDPELLHTSWGVGYKFADLDARPGGYPGRARTCERSAT